MSLVAPYLGDAAVFPFTMSCKSCYQGAKSRSMRLNSECGQFCERLPLLVWAVSEGCPLVQSMVNAAAATGNIPVLEWLRFHSPHCLWSEVTCGFAAQYEQLDTLIWLRAQKPDPCPWDEESFNMAIAGGRIDILNWMKREGCPWDETAYYTAAKCGGGCNKEKYTAILHWLRSQWSSCPGSQEACSGAAAAGHVSLLQWLRLEEEPPFPYSSNACTEAAANGQLEALQWLRSQKPPCTWNEGVCSSAAKRGDLEMLQWARSGPDPCRWGHRTCMQAAYYGHLEVLQWLRSQEPPCPWVLSDIRLLADLRPEIISWLDTIQ